MPNPTPPFPIAAQLSLVEQRIDAACQEAGRARSSVTLLAVSKTFAADAVRTAFAAGQRHFGENYIQEGVDKIEAVHDLRQQGLVWHCIGPIQSNKTRLVAEHFDWVHSVDRVKTAERLAAQRPAHLPPLQVCLQVNIDAGANKSGVPASEVEALARAIQSLPGLQLRGLMTLPEPSQTLSAQRAVHRQAHELFERLRAKGLVLDTLSMGMSADLEAAILEGSTLVRVGTAIFGKR